MADKVVGVKRGRGRPRKVVVEEKPFDLFDEIENASNAVFADLKAAYDLFSEGGQLAKYEAIKKRVDDVAAKAELLGNASQGLRIMTMPWMTRDSPKMEGRKVIQQLNIIQRIVEKLERHLVDYLLIQTALQRRLADIETQAKTEANRLPEGHLEFIRRLHAAGIQASKLAKFSTADIEALARFVNARQASESMAGLEGLARQSNRRTPAETDAIVAAAEALDAKATADLKPIPEMVLPDDDGLPRSLYGPTWNDPTSPVPKEFWDGVIDVGMPYRFENRKATAEEVETIARFPLPLRDSWDSLRDHDSDFRAVSDDFVFTVDSLETMAADYISHVEKSDVNSVPEAWKKAWILLMYARHKPADMMGLLGDRAASYFDGVGLPLVALGGNNIRVLVPVKS